MRINLILEIILAGIACVMATRAIILANRALLKTEKLIRMMAKDWSTSLNKKEFSNSYPGIKR
jgi:glutathionyl-hydroquinone reductase